MPLNPIFFLTMSTLLKIIYHLLQVQITANKHSLYHIILQKKRGVSVLQDTPFTEDHAKNKNDTNRPFLFLPWLL